MDMALFGEKWLKALEAVQNVTGLVCFVRKILDNQLNGSKKTRVSDHYGSSQKWKIEDHHSVHM